MKAGRGAVAAAFAAVYVIWGTTFLAGKVVVGVLPPFLVAGVRAVVAGGVLYGWARMRGASRPVGRELVWGVMAGLLLFGVGHGSLYWSLQRVPSGMAAVLDSTIPLWVVVFEGLRRSGPRPSAGVVGGVVLGFAGLVWLNLPSTGSGVAPGSAVVVLAGAAAWGLGSVWYGGVRRHGSAAVSAALPLLGGGTALLLVSALSGEAARVTGAALRPVPVLALGYLVVFGSLVAFSADTWLLGRVSATRVASHAYVNPLIALVVGAHLGGERLSGSMLAPIAVVVVGVVLVVAGGSLVKRVEGSAEGVVQGGPMVPLCMDANVCEEAS